MQEDKLKIWFENLKNKIKNDITIFLSSPIEINNSIVGVKILPYTSKNINLQNNNIIIYKEDNFLIGNYSYLNKSFFLQLFNNPVIIINDEKSIRKFINLLKNFQENENLDYYAEIEYYVLEKKDFNQLIEMERKELIKLLKDEHKYLNLICPELPLLDEGYLERQKKILDNEKILSANFANYLYRFANLDFYSSTTRIGREVRKILGIKSKTINDVRTVDIKFPKGKPFKGYDLNVEHLEIKKKIAQNFIYSLNVQYQDIGTIARITELPIKEVKKLF